MKHEVYRFEFTARVGMDDVQHALDLAALAVESLYGRALMKMEQPYYVNTGGRFCVVDADTALGRDIAQVFTGFMRHGFGEGGFTVERVDSPEKNSIVQAVLEAMGVVR